MKTKSPAHKLIQLRRKTEKIVLPKASWDLSNKQNKDILNCYDVSRSKNNSSKKNSLQKKLGLKKSNSLTHNTLKGMLKNLSKENCHVRREKQKENTSKSRMNYNSRKNDSRTESFTGGNKYFEQKMNVVLKQQKKEKSSFSTTLSKQQYQILLKNYQITTPQQKHLIKIMRTHLAFWMNQCQQLQKQVKHAQEVTPKYYDQAKYPMTEMQKILMVSSHGFEQNAFLPSSSSPSRASLNSNPSCCSYLVDPQEFIEMHPMKQSLKEKLQLNFSKIEDIRKREYQQ